MEESNKTLTRNQIIAELKKYFDIRELVCPHTHKKFGDNSWQFLDTELLNTLLILRRDIFKCGMLINNWHTGGKFDERGLRCNICSLCRAKTLKGLIYLTAHANGAGLDFDVKGLTAEQARKKIDENKHLLPVPIRLESEVSWVHFDIYDMMNGKPINYFAA